MIDVDDEIGRSVKDRPGGKVHYVRYFGTCAYPCISVMVKLNPGNHSSRACPLRLKLLALYRTW